MGIHLKSVGRSCVALLLILAPLSSWADERGHAIELNQIGWPPGAHKLAIAPADAQGHFVVEDAASGKIVFSGELGNPAEWEPAQQSVRIADFSALTVPGRYRLHIDGLASSGEFVSDEFVISQDVYAPLGVGAVKAYYFNRASTALDALHAGIYARAEGHPDDVVYVHASAASPRRPEGTRISAPKGWYDAGDYNKYVVNAAVATHQLLDAYEDFPQVFAAQSLNLPESGNGAPDVLNEAWWNLQWMLDMQDPNDGGVYHKLTTLKFSGFVMPDQDRAPRYVVQKSTAATLDFAAVMAQASRAYARYDAQFPGASAHMLAAAKQAWAWAQQHPAIAYQQPADVFTGKYEDTHLDDEFSWAATELLLATSDTQFREAFVSHPPPMSVPNWQDVGGFAWLALAANGDGNAEKQVCDAADRLLREWETSAYRVSMRASDFIWGSNAAALNRAVVLLQAYRLRGKRAWLDAAQSQLDYVLGRNPLGRSFVTGFGAHPPLQIHQRLSAADGIAAPVPGWLVAGPNPGQQDFHMGCEVPYPSKVPALSYHDVVCAYASNEVAINWNAPLVYVVAGLQALTPPARQ